MENVKTRQKAEQIARRLIEELHALGGDYFATVVITQNNQALVVSNDNPANAIMGIASSWNMPVTFDCEESKGINPAQYVYHSTAKH